MFTKGAFCERYARILIHTQKSALPFARTLLRGHQQIGYPVAALRSRRYMEAPRHILAQMVVAGTHMVPFGSGMPFFGQSAGLPSRIAPVPPAQPWAPPAPPAPTQPSWVPPAPGEVDLDPLGILVELTRNR